MAKSADNSIITKYLNKSAADAAVSAISDGDTRSQSTLMQVWSKLRKEAGMSKPKAKAAGEAPAPVNIVVTSNQDPTRIARAVSDAIAKPKAKATKQKAVTKPKAKAASATVVTSVNAAIRSLILVHGTAAVEQELKALKAS